MERRKEEVKVCWVEVVEEEKGEESLDMEEKGEESLAMDELEESPGIKMFVQADILSGLRLSSTEKTFFKSSWHYNIYFLCVTLVLLILMYTGTVCFIGSVVSGTLATGI